MQRAAPLEDGSLHLYQISCFDAGSTKLNNPPFSCDSQRRVAAPFDPHAGSRKFTGHRGMFLSDLPPAECDLSH
jgi:hypothetical protein